MIQKPKSVGICLYCREVLHKSAITQHLGKHLELKALETPAEKERSYQLSIRAGEMFLEVLVRGSSTFKTLDTFLRKIWVDCCDHLSGFKSRNFQIRMSEKFFRVLEPKQKFEYIYDYGSSTVLDITVANVYPFDAGKDLILLSRNEPLPIMCSVCKKKSATCICVEHIYETEECYFCDSCAPAHEDVCEAFADYASMPVVNSPRMGVCGYDGGSIDKDRDGVYSGKA
jgi:hypothetical protein